MFPATSTATLPIELKTALVAKVPSALNPLDPLPATVEIIPAVFTFRTQLFPASAINKLPAASIVTSVGECSWAADAAVPSPL